MGTAPVDIYEHGGHIVLVADLPGVTSADLEIELDGDRLTLFGRRGAAAQGSPVAGDGRPTDWGRSFFVPDGIDHDAIRAELKNGVLVLTLPKVKEGAGSRRIEVHA
jgi:HSP20 family protein